MKLSQAEFEQVKAQGLHVTEKCDGCGRILNQSFRYTVTGKPEVYCAAICRDTALLGAKLDRVVNGEKCFQCHGHKQPGGLYCINCRQHADPHGVKISAEGLPCLVCGEPVPALRRASGSGTCSARCADTLRQRRRRNGYLGESDPIILVPQLTDSLGIPPVTKPHVEGIVLLDSTEGL